MHVGLASDRQRTCCSMGDGGQGEFAVLQTEGPLPEEQKAIPGPLQNLEQVAILAVRMNTHLPKV